MACLAGAALPGTAQSLVETAAVAWVYRNLVLAPPDFFNTRLLDGYVKLFGMLWADALGAGLLGGFQGQEFFPKLALLPSLLAMNVGVALVLGVVLGTISSGFTRIRERLSVAGVVLAVGAAEALLHVVLWAIHVHLRRQPTATVVLKSHLRAFLYDGTFLALCSLLLACLFAGFLSKLASPGRLFGGAAMLGFLQPLASRLFPKSSLFRARGEPWLVCCVALPPTGRAAQALASPRTTIRSTLCGQSIPAPTATGETRRPP